MAANVMIDAAKTFIRRQDAESWQTFEQAEANWMALNPTERVSYAVVFKRFLDRSGISVPPTALASAPRGRSVRINTAWNPNYVHARGFVYAFWSERRAAHVKIGSTNRHPQDRLAEFIKRYPEWEDIRIIYLAEVSRPVAVELRLDQALTRWRRKLSRNDSVEWFEITPAAAVAKIEREIHLAGSQYIGQRFTHKKLAQMTEISQRALASANKGLLPGKSDYMDRGASFARRLR